MDTSIRPPAIRGHLMFFRSNDGGRTWTEQDPKLRGQVLASENVFVTIQQIDSLHVVAIGDSGLIVRTANAGNTWQLLDLGTTSRLTDVSFSDSNTGIVISLGHPSIYTTLDGGAHWSSFDPKSALWPFRAHSYGGGMFRVLTYAAGPFYTTYDNFKTIDSTEIYPFVDSTHILTDCNFTGGDTLIAYGVSYLADLISYHPLLTRSTDGGYSWTEVTVPDSSIKANFYMTSLEISPTFMGGHSDYVNLMSVDHGLTWSVDSMKFAETVDRYAINKGMTMTPKGEVIAIEDGLLPYTQGYLVRGTPNPQHVDSYERITNGTSLYPNPASERVKMQSVDGLQPVRLYDVLGREAMSGMLSAGGSLTFDVSKLPRSVYQVVLVHNGLPLSVGNLVVVDK